MYLFWKGTSEITVLLLKIIELQTTLCISAVVFMYPTHGLVVTQDPFIKQSKAALNSVFPFLANDNEPSLLYYLPIAWGRIDEFLPFPEESMK